MFRFDALARRRPRLSVSLLGETCLSTGIARLAPATFLAMGFVWQAYPTLAIDFSVANDAQLRSAVSSAGNGDTITFKANITLGSNLPTVTQNVGFNGGNFTLSGDNKYRGLFVQSGTVGINDLTITNAVAQGGKGGSGDATTGQGGPGGGGGGLGGALFVAAGARVSVQNVSLQNNSARGGIGGVGNGTFAAGGGGGGYWPIGADGANGSFTGGKGGMGGGGDGHTFDAGGSGGFGGGGGGGNSGGSGGFGGGGGGASGNGDAPGGFLGGRSGVSIASGSGGGGGAGLGGAIFVQQGGTLTLAGSLSISGNTVAGGDGGNGNDGGKPGGAAGSGVFLHGNGALTLAPGSAALTQTISDAIVDQTGAGGTGANAGSWSLVKSGAGTTILTGVNAYTGGTTVSSGALQGTSRSLQGAITNNAAVIFDQAFNGTYAGDMNGTGTLIKNGTGNLNLTGISNVGGGTTINAGGFAVNGHLTSNVTLNKGGTLSGAGNIKGDVTNNGGTIKPGNSIGHLRVDGNFTLNSGTYEVEVSAKGDSDRISVVGADHKVMINAGTLQIVPEPGTYVPNTTYTIITTEGGGTVKFDTVTGGVGFLTPKVSLDREHIYVSLALAPNAFRSAGQTVNQQAVGGALDAIAASGNVGGLVTTMANLQPAQGASAFQALSGQAYADFGTVNVQASQMFMNAVGRQMAVARGAGFGAPPSVALAEACTVACDADTGTPPRFSAWLSGIGSTGSVAGDNNAAGLTYTLGGTAFGIDYRLDPRFLFGIASGYLGGTQWVNGFAGNGYTDALSVALYGSFTPNGPAGGFYADALAGYANASNRMQRVVSVPGLQTAIANGNTSANQFLGQIETGYKFGLGFPANASISPFGLLQIGSVNQAGFTESGQSSFNLAVASQTTTSVRSTFGADLSASFDLGRGTLLDLGLRLGWMHEFADTTRPMTAGFAAAPGPQFTVFGATPTRNSAVIGFSAAMALNDRTSLFASYDGEVGGGTNNHQLRAGFRLTW